VPDELWERVQELRARRTRTSGPRAASRPRPLLSGLLRCSCQAAIHSNGTHRDEPMIIHRGPACDRWGERLTYPSGYYEDAIAAQLTGITIDDADVAALVRLLSTPAAPVRGRVSVDRRRRDLALAHADGRLTDEEYLEARRQLERETEAPAVHGAIDAAAVVRWVRDLPRLWEYADPDQRRELVNLVYDRIVVEGTRFVEAIPTPYAMARGLPALLPERVTCWNGEPGRVAPITSNHGLSIPVRGRRELLRAMRRSA
jgi:hypothetical protein